MADSPTLHSRLRILVAKTFRAERLYSSIRTTSKPASSATLSEMANDIRADVWQRCHNRLRSSLNDILSRAGSSAVAGEVATLRDSFAAEADKEAEAVTKGIAALAETAQRQEFARALKLSMDLIRHKAGAQSNRVIADEIAGVLNLSGKQNVEPRPIPLLNETPEPLTVNETYPPSGSVETKESQPSNVVSIKHRLVSSGRSRRR